MMLKATRAILIVVALFYVYGASVHVMNMLSLTGFAWPDAPLKWQALDVIYLVLDLLVVVGLLREWRPGVAAFYIAALSQILLYTLGRQWVLDVPEPFTVTPEQAAYVTSLVWFHVVTLLLVTPSLLLRQRHRREVF